MTRLFRCKSATPVNASADADSEVVVDSLLLRDLLRGTCTYRSLKSCRTDNLERLLFKVLRMHAASEAEALTNLEVKPPWWPDDILPFQEVKNVREQVHNVVATWHSTLAAVLDSCVQYYGQKSLKTPRKPLKRPAMDSPRSIRTPSPSPGPSCDPEPSTPKRLKLDVNEILNSPKTPVVVLKDVLKEKYPVLDKTDYMSFLKLQPTNLPVTNPTPSVINSHNLHKWYPFKVPFSSPYGKRLRSGGRYGCVDAAYGRKRDWTNAYLVESTRSSSERSSKPECKYEVTYKPKNNKGCERRYSFPLRQHRQRRNAIKGMKQAFCRPLSVRLPRLNIQPYLLREQMQRVCVYIDKRKTDSYIVENIASTKV